MMKKEKEKQRKRAKMREEIRRRNEELIIEDRRKDEENAKEGLRKEQMASEWAKIYERRSKPEYQAIVDTVQDMRLAEIICDEDLSGSDSESEDEIVKERKRKMKERKSRLATVQERQPRIPPTEELDKQLNDVKKWYTNNSIKRSDLHRNKKTQ